MRCIVGLFFILFVPGNYAKNLTVSVFYESLCPDSVDFLVNQFDKAYKSLKENLIVDLVPFGKATAKWTSGTWNFTCQHGPNECYGNMVHSCAINLAPINNSTEFVVCAMKSNDASLDSNLEKCAIDAGLDWPTIQGCAKSKKGGDLLAANGNRTGGVRPRVTFIPTVVFGHQYKEALQTIALKNFLEISEFLIDESDCERCKSSGAPPMGVRSLVVLLLSSVVVAVKLL